MAEELTRKRVKRSFPAVPPPLSPSLTNLYNTLDSFNKGVFMQVFRFIWGYLFGCFALIRRSGVLYQYWIIDTLRDRAKLTASELSALSWLYHITDKGTKYIHSEQFYSSGCVTDLQPQSKLVLLNILKRRGYITRHMRDPSAPYLSRSYQNHYVFIFLTRSGVNLIEGIEKNMYKLLLNSSLDDLTGIKKP